jgi:hypothetical protein
MTDRTHKASLLGMAAYHLIGFLDGWTPREGSRAAPKKRMPFERRSARQRPAQIDSTHRLARFLTPTGAIRIETLGSGE